MKFISKMMFGICSIAFSSFATENVEPTSVFVTYGSSSISAVIQKGKEFSAVEEKDEERIKLSGFVTKEYPDYIVDVVVVLVRENKHRKSSREINTTILVKGEELGNPIVIGGVDDEKARLTLQTQGKS